MAEVVERFPLFPLGIVLLPHEVVPLHIFEQRYRTMIGECLEGGGEFGVVWLSEGGLREVGCAARIARVLERYDDGRLDILTEGTRPFRLLRRVEHLAYPAGDVESLDDEPAVSVEPALAEAARALYAELVDRATDSRPEPAELEEADAYRMAGTVDVGLEAKQELLELRDEESRLRRVRTLFEETLNRLEYAERTSELARTNGRARPGRP